MASLRQPGPPVGVDAHSIHLLAQGKKRTSRKISLPLSASTPLARLELEQPFKTTGIHHDRHRRDPSSLQARTLDRPQCCAGLVIVFLLIDGAIKLVPWPIVTETMDKMGYGSSETLARSLGLITIVCTVLYSIPPTSILGAILLTGYLGGAMASHVRIGSPLFTHTLFGLYLGLMVWGGLWLRDRNLRGLIPSAADVLQQSFTNTEPVMFEVIVIIAVILAIAIAAVLVLAATKPDTLRVQRSVSIKAPPERIFPLIYDFHQWRLVALRAQGSGDEAHL